MARPRLEIPHVGLKIRIPEPLYQKVHLLLLDPVRGRVRSGAWTKLSTDLYTRWVNEQITKRNNFPRNSRQLPNSEGVEDAPVRTDTEVD